ncbi:DUF551 domain-containing protein [Salmonella enterica]|nr:DUF551 domain-containing protein [Salmonella enterica]
MKENQITASMAKDIAFKLGAVLNGEEAEIFADGYNAALLKVNKNASTELPNYTNLSTSSQAAPDDSVLLPCPFCGSPAEHYPDGDMEGYIIMCGNKNGDCNLQAFGFTTPEEAEKAWNTRAALLQGGQPVSQTYELPQTQFEQVADLYEMQFDDGRICAFHTDGAKAAQWLLACDGNKVQEYVRIERYQEAVIGNSPVTQDGWISCSERMPNDKQYVWCWGKSYGWTEYDTFEGYYDWSRNKWWAVTDDGEEPASKVTHWMPLPEPPQEVKGE